MQEIIKLLPITRVPKSPDFIEGVINLRGNVIPVVNVHRRLGLEKRENTEKTRIVVVEVQRNSVGLIVDQVLEVLYLSQSAFEPPTVAGNLTNTAFIQGIGLLYGRLFLLLDLDALLDLKRPEVAS